MKAEVNNNSFQIEITKEHETYTVKICGMVFKNVTKKELLQVQQCFKIARSL